MPAGLLLRVRARENANALVVLRLGRPCASLEHRADRFVLRDGGCRRGRARMSCRNFMFMFVGVMFCRVASGLCIYFVASSTWGILERKLLPKISDPEAYLEKLAEERRQKKSKPGFMVRMMEMTEAQQRNQATGGDSQRRKQLDSLRSGRRRR